MTAAASSAPTHSDAGHGPLTMIISVSDEIAHGLDDDRGGDVAAALLSDLGVPVRRAVVPDEPARIEQEIRAAIAGGARVVMTCGGTGVGPNDHTAAVVGGLLSYPLPGIGEEIRRRGAAHAAPALLSREVAGVVTGPDHRPVFLLAAPGSRGGVRDAVAVIGPLLGHLVEQLDGAGHQCVSKG